MNRKEKIYMARLARCSMKELISIRDYVAARRGNMRFASMMLRCITTAILVKAILVKAGLEPA